MPKSLLALLLLVSLTIHFSAYSQENESSLIRAKIKHGSVMIGGSINGSYLLTSSELNSAGNQVDSRVINAALRGKNGYFVREDLVVGLDLSVLHRSSKVTSITDAPSEAKRETFVMAGPFARYYLLNGVFGELSMLAGLQNFNDVNAKYKAIGGSLGVGYAYFINEKFSLEPVLSFRYFQKVDRNDRSYRELGPMLGFGLQVYLLRKRSHIIKQGL
ncbi:outer membrane beta-barrel protein [Pontibacter sp. JH31]|uniref:Outer membrane beta-barrel protein n=1 Tax=Pontibacter aquaedesilientis TaxID=2766980 RepID=A0ABR7XDA3_9BACT|nr:autotransporter outer membrane beta-barrel domain-containing protein [Pontibacter aquaedesilientis]MBD1396277.1 outer membrane beta-barrel protein [Pontibacter aquaedesilientis]